MNHLREVSLSLKTEIEKIESMNKSLSAEINASEAELVRTKKRDSIISSSIAKYMTRLQSMVDHKIDNELSELTDKKAEVLRKIENNEIGHREIITSIKSLENEIASSTERKNEISNERESLQREKIERQDQNESASQRLEQLEKELIGLREEEQKIIDVSGDSYSTLQNYEKQIKSLDEKERQLYREINGIEKESIAIKKDISNFTAQ